MLPLGPMFHHVVKMTMRITPTDRPPYITTMERAIPWQAPPPRQGQRRLVPCESLPTDSWFRFD